MPETFVPSKALQTRHDASSTKGGQVSEAPQQLETYRVVVLHGQDSRKDRVCSPN